MNKVIKGITIAIGADFSAVGKAVDGVDKKFRGLQTELRQVDKLLKLDPKNTELLAQKQKLLAESVQTTQERLSTLKQAQDKVADAFREGKIDESQYRAFQREVAATEQSLKKLEEQQKETADAIKHANDKVKASAEEIKSAKESISKLGDGIKGVAEKAGKGLLAIATAVAGAGTYCLNFSTDFDKALNNVATKTGATKDETAELEKVMEDVYKNNFGEDIGDVANSMAIVKQQTGLANQALQETTEYGLMLRDTFDFEVNESTRAAKMLMDQFGVSSEEAYTLIAQGAQNGLDKNGDMLDTINEYSVHFKQAGFDAEGMFNMLVNGSQKGTFSVDKLGDTIKEFFIRAKDGSDGTKGALKDLGLNADKLTKKFADGGESSKEAFQQVTDKLFALDDTVKQNQIGVALFGTMWEDLGADGVKALTNIDGSADQTADTLKKINDTKYDDLGNNLEELGRTIKTDVIKPLGDELKPHVKDLINQVKDHAPEIRELVKKIIDKVKEAVAFVIKNKKPIINVITGIAGALVAAKIASTVGGIITSVQTLHTAISNLFTLISAHPIGALISALGFLVGAIVAVCESSDDFKSANQKQAEIIKEITESAKEQSQAFLDLKESQQENATESVKEIDRTKALWQELQNLVDETGNVLDKNKERARFLVEELQPVLGDAVKWNENETVSINDTAEAIDNLIAKKRAEKILESQNEGYQTAQSKSRELEIQQVKAYNAVLEKKNDVKQAEIDLTNAEQELKAAEERGLVGYQLDIYKNSVTGSKWRLKNTKDDLRELQAAYKNNEETLAGYYRIISTYEDNYAAVLSNNYEKIKEINYGVGDSFKTATTATREELKKQADDLATESTLMRKRLENHEEGVTEDMYKAVQARSIKAQEEYRKLGKTQVNSQSQGFDENNYKLEESAQAGVDKMSSVTSSAILDGPTVGPIDWRTAAQEARNKLFAFFKDPIKVYLKVDTDDILSQGQGPRKQGSFTTGLNFGIKQNAKGGVFNRETLIGYTVGEAGREAIMPLNRKVYTEIGTGIMDSIRRSTKPIRGIFDDAQLRYATAAPYMYQPAIAPVARSAPSTINQTNIINSPAPLSASEIARKNKIMAMQLAVR